jgi:hypothetical protein
VKQALQDGLCSDQAGQVIARLTSLFAFALNLAQLETTTDEFPQIDATNKHLPPRFGRLQVESMLSIENVECLGFDQCDVTGFWVVEITVAFETFSGMCRRGRHRLRHGAVIGGKVDRLDSA